MSNPRPICDFWILARPKVKYYGAFPAGFLERARDVLVNGSMEKSVLHVCGGKVKEYNGVKGGIPFNGFGPNDKTIDIDPKCDPDVLYDVKNMDKVERDGLGLIFKTDRYYDTPVPDAILIDRPYTPEDADEYNSGSENLPNINKLLKDCLELTDGPVGVLDYIWPNPGKEFKEIYSVAVSCGRNNRIRIFTVWRKRNKL